VTFQQVVHSRKTRDADCDDYQLEGSAGLHDHSSRPHRSPRRTGEALAQHVEQLRRQRFTGFHIAKTTA
jgi:hypothetical protein